MSREEQEISVNGKTDLNYMAAVWCAALALQGCATGGKSLALGGAIGAGSGAVLGGIVDPGKNGQYRTRNVVIGSAFGGMAGMATAALLHDNAEDKKKEAYLAGQESMKNRPAPPPDGPGLTQATVKIEWIEGRAIGNKWVDGHYERTISEPVRWQTDSK